MQTYLNIPEGVGATLSHYDDQLFFTGTFRCLSCVGVYFKIDKSRCFMAHINAYSAVTFPYNSIRSRGSRDIEDQVVERLCGFVKKFKWDIHDEDFGKDIVLVCSVYKDIVVDSNTKYERIGKAVVRGIQQFFKYCRYALRDKQNATTDKVVKTSISIQCNIEFLDALAEDMLNKVQSDCHGFVVEPSTGSCQTFIIPKDKKLVDPAQFELRTTSGIWKPEIFKDNEDICVFILTKDRPQDFPINWLSESLYRLGQEYQSRDLQKKWSDRGFNGRPDNLLLPQTSTNLNQSPNRAIKVSNPASVSTNASGPSRAAGGNNTLGSTFRGLTIDDTSRSRNRDTQEDDLAGGQEHESSRGHQTAVAGSQRDKRNDSKQNPGRSQKHEPNGGQSRRDASRGKRPHADIPLHESGHSSGRSRPRNTSNHKDKQPSGGEREPSDRHRPRTARSQKDKQIGNQHHN